MIRRSSGGVLAEVDRNPPVVVEHRDQFQARAKCFEILAEGRHADVVGVLELRDRSLRDVDLVEPELTDRVFHALADATRRDIVTRTLRAEHSVSSLARLYPMSFAAVQKHVVVLADANLVTKRRQGREQLVTANVHTIRQAARVLDHFEALWHGRIDRIAEILADDAPKGATS